MATDFLDMDGWTTTNRRPVKDGELVVDAAYAPEPGHCPKCGTVSQIARWGTKEMNRAGRGYSYDVIRARLLFGKGIPERPLKTCESCNGLLEPEIMSFASMFTSADQTKIRVHVCANCHRRIYMERPKSYHDHSTLKSE